MENNSREFIFVLHGLNDTKTNKHIYFAFGLVIYIVTLLLNLTLIIAVVLDKTLHEPMYVFICSLYVNGICGASAFYPKILADLFSDFHSISHTGCLLQIFIIYCYIFCELTCLTVMAYDRYVAICKPLEYHTIMTKQKVMKLLIFMWVFSALETAVGTTLTAQLPVCGNDIDKIYCSNWEVVKLSCIDVTLNNIYGYLLLFYHAGQAVFIFVSYVRIVRASVRSKTEQVKFMQTCLPHLITLMNFTISVIFDIIYARYGKSLSQQALRNILAMEFLVVPPLLNPIIYGLKMTQIRHRFLKMYIKKRKEIREN